MSINIEVSQQNPLLRTLLYPTASSERKRWRERDRAYNRSNLFFFFFGHNCNIDIRKFPGARDQIQDTAVTYATAAAMSDP